MLVNSLYKKEEERKKEDDKIRLFGDLFLSFHVLKVMFTSIFVN